LEQASASTIDVDEILGQANYVSPNGVAFTNGLKVKFIGDVIPANYASGTFNLLCTSAEFGTNYITTASTANLYVGEQITFSVPTIGGLTPGTYYIQSVAPNGIQFTVSVQQYGTPVVLSPGTANVTAIVTSNLEYYVSNVGTAIELLPVTDYITPETYVVDNDTTTINAEPDTLDYLTIDRASKDLNPWTRSNRW
jgi:hypothetical protein